MRPCGCMAHERSDRAAHGGRLSERFQFEAQSGSRFFVSYALPRVLVTADLGLSLYVRANRAGAQLFGWVVLPADIDPETRAPSYVLVPGTVFNRPDRWQKLELFDLLPAVEEQARVLRSSTRRPVPLQGAYLERVVVNLMGGMGESEVFLDDLEVGPVPQKLAADWSAGHAEVNREVSAAGGVMHKAAAAKDRAEATLPPIRFSRNAFSRLIESQRRYVPWFPTAVEAAGADPIALRQAGYDVLVTDARPDRRKLQSIVKSGMFLLPRLEGADDEQGGAERIKAEMSQYPLPQSVALWSIGEHLGRQREVDARTQQIARIREAIAAVREREDELNLATATVDGEYRKYARSPANLDVIGVDLPIWGTSQSFEDGFEYLKQRRFATARSNAEAVFWAWLPAAPSEVVTRNIWGTDLVPTWGTPPVQADQLRLMTYMALSGGCRGLTFIGDADLTRPVGEPALIEMNFLNAEIDLFEQILAQNTQQIAEYKTFDPDPAERPSSANVNMKRMPLIAEYGGKPGLRAAAIPLPGSKGCLLLVADYGWVDGFGTISQWQPTQAAYNNLVINPRVPQGVQFLEVSPGDAHFLETKTDDRVPGRHPSDPPGLRLDHHGPLYRRHGVMRAGPWLRPAHPAPRGPDGDPAGRAPARPGPGNPRAAESRRPPAQQQEGDRAAPEAGHRGETDGCRRPGGQGRGVHQERPGRAGGRGLRHRLDRGPPRRPPITQPDGGLLAPGHDGAPRDGRRELLRQEARVSPRSHAALSQPAGHRHRRLVPARHLLLHSAPVAHLEGLDQRTGGLPVRSQPGPLRLVRRGGRDPRRRLD